METGVSSSLSKALFKLTPWEGNPAGEAYQTCMAYRHCRQRASGKSTLSRVFFARSLSRSRRIPFDTFVSFDTRHE